MRQIITRVSVALGLILVFAFLIVPNAFAAAHVIKNFPCLLLASDSGLAEDVFAVSSHAVNSPSGNSKIICHFSYKGAGLPKSAVHIKGFVCGTYGGLTTNSMLVITPSGRILLKCMHNKHQDQQGQVQVQTQSLLSASILAAHGGPKNEKVTGANP